MEFKAFEVRRLRTIRDALAGAGDELSLPQLVSLLTVAIEPGLSVNDLAERIGAPQQSASRYVSVLLARYQSIEGLGPRQPLIVQEVSTSDPRKRALFLTERGSELVGRMIRERSASENRGA